MQSSVETLSPTKVKLTVEAAFDELKPELDKAYRTIGSQVKVQGFRPGKVPPRILDQRVGRGAVLEEAVNQAIPRLYGEAVESTSITPLGRPEIDVTELNDNEKLAFTAEVEVRVKKRSRRNGKVEESGELAIHFGSIESLNGLIERIRRTA